MYSIKERYTSIKDEEFVKDFEKLSEDKIIRMDQQVFITTYLNEIKDRNTKIDGIYYFQDIQEYLEKEKEKKNIILKNVKGVVLNFKDKVSDNKSNSSFYGRKYIKDIDFSTTNNIETINLTCNYLRKPIVFTVCSKALESIPTLKFIDLSYNQFEIDSWRTLDDLLKKLKEDQYISLVGSPLASVDSKANFSYLTKECWKKLIWIPKAWLEDKKWINSLPSKTEEEVIQIIYDTHELFYSKFDL